MFNVFTISTTGLALFLSAAAIPNQSPVDTAIVMAAEISLTIDSENGLVQRQAHADALRSPAFITAIRDSTRKCVSVSYVEWTNAGRHRTVLPWTRICEPEDANRAAAIIESEGRNKPSSKFNSISALSSAVDAGSLALDSLPMRAARKVMTISADVYGNADDALPASRDKARAKGYWINAIILPDHVTRRENGVQTLFAEKMINGDGAFVVAADSSSDYLRLVADRLIETIRQK